MYVSLVDIQKKNTISEYWFEISYIPSPDDLGPRICALTELSVKDKYPADPSIRVEIIRANEHLQTLILSVTLESPSDESKELESIISKIIKPL